MKHPQTDTNKDWQLLKLLSWNSMNVSESMHSQSRNLLWKQLYLELDRHLRWDIRARLRRARVPQ